MKPEDISYEEIFIIQVKRLYEKVIELNDFIDSFSSDKQLLYIEKLITEIDNFIKNNKCDIIKEKEMKK